MRKSLFVFLVTVLAAGSAMAQAGWNWPEDKETAETKNALYTDNYKQGNYRKAANHLYWLLINAPDLNKSIYINGAKIYDGLADETQDEAQKKVYQDSVMVMYDLRVKYFNEEASVYNRKLFDAYKFYKADQSRYEMLFEIAKKTFELNGNDIWDQNLVVYMDALRRYKKTGGNVTDDEVLDIYGEVSDVIDYKKENDPNERLNPIQDNVDKLFAATIDVDCEKIENSLGPRLEADPTNLSLAENIMKLSFAGKCLDSDIFLKSVKIVHENKPEFGLAKLIGAKCVEQGDFDCATKYYEQAITLTDDNTRKADAYEALAKINAKQGRKSTARDYAQQMVSVDPTRKDAYSIIGSLYFNSFNDCKGGENPVHDRAVYIAAYNMYSRAGDSSGMSAAKAQFPSTEEIFTFNMEKGQSYKVGCWIQETVTIQSRD